MKKYSDSNSAKKAGLNFLKKTLSNPDYSFSQLPSDLKQFRWDEGYTHREVVGRRPEEYGYMGFSPASDIVREEWRTRTRSVSLKTLCAHDSVVDIFMHLIKQDYIAAVVEGQANLNTADFESVESLSQLLEKAKGLGVTEEDIKGFTPKDHPEKIRLAFEATRETLLAENSDDTFSACRAVLAADQAVNNFFGKRLLEERERRDIQNRLPQIVKSTLEESVSSLQAPIDGFEKKLSSMFKSAADEIKKLRERGETARQEFGTSSDQIQERVNNAINEKAQAIADAALADLAL